MTDYTTVQAVRALIGSESSGAADAVLERLITAVSRHIDRACRRPDGFVAAAQPTARLFPARGGAWLAIDECISVGSVAVRPGVSAPFLPWDAADWLAIGGAPDAPRFAPPFTWLGAAPGGAHLRFPHSPAAPAVQVTARWGYAESVPEAVSLACAIVVAGLYRRGASGFADLQGGEGLGTLRDRGALDGDAHALLRDGGFIRPLV
jgi:hypothetical protein